MTHDFKIRIVQPGVPEYRRGLFNRLGRRYGERIELWANDFSGIGPACRLDDMKMDYTHNWRYVLGPLKWQRGLSTQGLSKGDVLVICGDIHYLSTLWMALVARLRGIGVVWWGHHKSASSTYCKIVLRLKLAQLFSNVYLCYTREGKDFLVSHGMNESRVFFTGNTLDQDPIEAAITYWNASRLASFRQKHHLDGKKLLLFCSVLREKTHLEQVFEAMTINPLKDSDIVLVVIGDGESRELFEKKAIGASVADRVIWTGALMSQMDLAPWFLSATAYVYPGAIGLSLIHAYFYGLPVVVHDNASNQGPEFVAMHDGQTGYVFREGDASSLAERTALLLSDMAKRQEMGRAAQELARREYSMDNMAANYAEAIEAAHSVYFKDGK